MKTSAEIREAFFNYFIKQGHELVSSSSLVPVNDPSLLFTNAGMVQFKDVFLGKENRSYVRATSSQRCVRAGGKHNDLENVGYTARHHTFFEMLGNFSFGDYFKQDAIQFAWQFLTQEMALPEERLWITIYEEDDEAAEIWLKQIGVNPDHFSRIGSKDNFWSMGETGPCGPCTEIFYDHGSEIPGGPPGSEDEDGDRYVEIWNLVFMQYNRSKEGVLTPLPKPSVDTGMGLERLAAIKQNVHSNYDIDIFQALIKAAAEITHCKDLQSNSLKVIADHIRSCAFLVLDGVLPSNEGRGYVLRRIIRRAIRHAYQLEVNEPFFYQLVDALVMAMGAAYPELEQSQQQIRQILLKEEVRFAETLDQGMKILEQDINALSGNVISGETIFKLYDTFGFPVDLTADIARERNLMLDMDGYHVAMGQQKERARAASRFEGQEIQLQKTDFDCEFTGYHSIAEQSKILALYQDGNLVDMLAQGKEGVIIIDKTPFYAESGGQVGDIGKLSNAQCLFEVNDTQKMADGIHGLYGVVRQGKLSSGDELMAEIEHDKRQAIAINHSATHLLHAALRQILGEHINQKGSLVTPERLRFDFSHSEPVSKSQLSQIETLVNDQIRLNADVKTEILSLEAAKNSGATALFGEKYGNEVRVLSIGEFSKELCGGTHVSRAGDIGYFKIVSESGIASGVRRIEGVAGNQAIQWSNKAEQQLIEITQMLKSNREDVVEKLQLIIDKNRHLDKALSALKSKLASNTGGSLSDQAKDIQGCMVLAAILEGVDAASLRETVDQLKNKLKTAIIVLAVVKDGKVALIAGVTKDKITQAKAGELINFVAQQVGGKGGGRPDMAQAGGKNPENINAALESVYAWAEEKLS